MNIIIQRIVGGFTSKNNYPFMATLWMLEGNALHYKCGGSFIGKNIILSAAHCVYKRDIRRMVIRMGSNHIHKQKHNYRVKKVIVHNGFNPSNLQNDIALLFLDKSPSYDNYKPLQIPCDHMITEINKYGNTLKVLGFGIDKPNATKKHLDELREINVKIIPKEQTAYNHNIVTNNMICANNIINGVVCDACTGDSGGPAIIFIKNKWIIVGIVSWGSSCAKKNLPGVYTKVSSYHKWIRKVCNFPSCSNE